jgi:sn-glycerol 3-phosphate transport system permease protein
MHKRVTYAGFLVPALLLLPQLAVTLVFFIWPASQALWQSTLSQDAFGLSTTFVGLDNFTAILTSADYLHSLQVTIVFSLAVTISGLVVSLLLAAMADHVIKGAGTYRTLLILPYAVAPALAGILWSFLFDPTVGIVAYLLHALGIGWNHTLNGNQAMILVIIAAAWKQISYNFLFFLAGLQAIPRSLIEAAAIDCAGPAKRFWTIALPLISPTTFFLLVVNVVYAFFDTFPIIHAVTLGGPADATNILIYKVFNDGFIGQDFGSSAAQSVVLMLIVGLLTAIQFRFVERRVQYG